MVSSSPLREDCPRDFFFALTIRSRALYGVPDALTVVFLVTAWRVGLSGAYCLIRLLVCLLLPVDIRTDRAQPRYLAVVLCRL